jgi:anhydro-N-acetylmuramic acid kinase
MAQYQLKCISKLNQVGMELYIGLMSGTSVDGIDTALVDFSGNLPRLVATHYTAYTAPVRDLILGLCQSGDNEIERLGELDVMLGKLFAVAANALLEKEALSPNAIKAIGSHGQTVRHQPHNTHGFTLQIGDPNIIANDTGITTVADFRRKDLACGGQGAPLVPAFHQQMFSSPEVDRAIVNIGGIANVTLLPKNKSNAIIGFDTGPGNTLIDAWVQRHQHTNHDENGQWARAGTVNKPLLDHLLADPYFILSAPKSTGREYFNLVWLEKKLSTFKNISAIDVQTTLVELTARTILMSIQTHQANSELLICGGGVHNTFLMKRIKELAGNTYTINTTSHHGIDPDWVEAAAFAWLARQTMNQLPGNLPSVTGASKTAILGGIYLKNA